MAFSIGKVGRYLLHVRLRHQGLPLPGSPFRLVVTPGPAHRSTTVIDASVLSGSVGYGAADGCSLLLRTHDAVGNACVEGGAKVVLSCSSSDCF